VEAIFRACGANRKKSAADTQKRIGVLPVSTWQNSGMWPIRIKLWGAGAPNKLRKDGECPHEAKPPLPRKRQLIW